MNDILDIVNDHWRSINEEIETLLHGLLDTEKGLTEDQIANILIGIKDLNNIRRSHTTRLILDHIHKTNQPK